MTAGDYIDAGVVFVYGVRGLEVHGPPNKPDLHDALLEDVRVRLDGVRDMPPSLPRSASECDACGDPLPRGRGGFCELCVLARQKVLAVGAVPAGKGTQ